MNEKEIKKNHKSHSERFVDVLYCLLYEPKWLVNTSSTHKLRKVIL